MNTRNARRSWILGSVLIASLVVVVTFILWSDEQQATRQAVVAQRGASVMPFDLATTQHQFATTSMGATETVTAKRADDHVAIGQIRSHLRLEAERFRAGDYRDPAKIHGSGMPGLAELESGAARITTTYMEIPAGATIEFVTSDPVLKHALAQWIAAQNMDHGIMSDRA